VTPYTSLSGIIYDVCISLLRINQHDWLHQFQWYDNTRFGNERMTLNCLIVHQN